MIIYIPVIVALKPIYCTNLIVAYVCFSYLFLPTELFLCTFFFADLTNAAYAIALHCHRQHYWSFVRKDLCKTRPKTQSVFKFSDVLFALKPDGPPGSGI